MPEGWKNQQLSHVSVVDDSGTKVIQVKDSRTVPYDTYLDLPEPIYGSKITFKYKIFVKDYGNTDKAYGPILYIKDNEGKDAMKHSIVMWGPPYYEYGKGDIGGLKQGEWYDMELEIDTASGTFHWTLDGNDWDSYELTNKVNNISRIGIRSNQMDENTIVYYKDLVVETTGYTGAGEDLKKAKLAVAAAEQAAMNLAAQSSIDAAQQAYDSARTQVNVLKPSAESETLQQQLETVHMQLLEAQAKLDVQTAESSMMQKDIDRAKSSIDRLPDGMVKSELTERVALVQRELDVEEILNEILTADYTSFTEIDVGIGKLYTAREMIASMPTETDHTKLEATYSNVKEELFNHIKDLATLSKKSETNRITERTLDFFIREVIILVDAKSQRDRGKIHGYAMPILGQHATGAEVNKAIDNLLPKE